jgi:hypothetical protein
LGAGREGNNAEPFSSRILSKYYRDDVLGAGREGNDAVHLSLQHHIVPRLGGRSHKLQTAHRRRVLHVQAVYIFSALQFVRVCSDNVQILAIAIGFQEVQPNLFDRDVKSQLNSSD